MKEDMLTIEDELLLKIYMQGFEDELDSKEEIIYDNKLYQSAYNYGRIDAVVGDDVSSIDEQTNREILNKIRNNNFI